MQLLYIDYKKVGKEKLRLENTNFYQKEVDYSYCKRKIADMYKKLKKIAGACMEKDTDSCKNAGRYAV